MVWRSGMTRAGSSNGREHKQPPRGLLLSHPLVRSLSRQTKAIVTLKMPSGLCVVTSCMPLYLGVSRYLNGRRS